MALLNMKKLTLIAHADSQNALLEEIQNIGAIEIIATRMEELNTASTPQSLEALESRLLGIRESLEVIRKHDDSKTSFLTPKPPITKSELKKMPEKFSEAKEANRQIRQFSEDISRLKTQKQRIKNRITQLTPYEKFDAPLEMMNQSQQTTHLLGMIPAENKADYLRVVEEYKDSAYFEKLDETKDVLSVFVVMMNKTHEKLIGELKYMGFSEAFANDMSGTPLEIIADYRGQSDAIDKQTNALEENAKEFVVHQKLLKALDDYLVNEIARERSIEKLGETGTTFMLEGWIIAHDQDRVEKALLTAAPESYIAFSAPKDDEIPPTATHNPKPVSPFEAVTNMYSVPSSKGFDPNVLMSVFYFLIFGMMIGDFAYGVILFIGALLILKIKKPTGMFRKITSVLMICGISTAFWGLVFGTIFSIEGIPSLINPINDAMTMLILCLGIGVLHILVGIGIGVYMDIKRKDIKAAIFDRISWMMVIVGAIMLALGGIAGTIGTYMALAGFLILLLTQGRHKKGIVKKAIGGLSSLYGVTGYVSDILSYSRIFGMGLATTVIAMVFNTIAGLLMGQWFGYIFGIVVMTVGHVFNIAMNSLGAFVHSARLQYIEFFSKFYEGDGHAFTPLGIRTKHYRLDG